MKTLVNSIEKINNCREKFQQIQGLKISIVDIAKILCLLWQMLDSTSSYVKDMDFY